ncbi:efflux RND transporter periplasmic adaptor subunit [Bradyrhizobium sp. KBS0727]|uniref:efflux RND transporter periplasmic adaptor subunit n=1 Tax=unclassified Bradyrhizobium TaxID=2631580 RepID=UPI00110DB752|nr:MULTISPECIES: efflux RND transporter periplasmic adaptor subunit [unclassified Bradyrhizobium]QDW37796.1 efflux RND transporter periplasmic adaptor subunit [Bradyrhizobium sp. KBS0725]QDW44400.1 efflux RND transporter periplasmic adaptor subunit [Bradyrhizobium sp. KBS0727]
MNHPKPLIAGLFASWLAAAGIFLWYEGIPSSIVKPTSSAVPARPVSVSADVVKEHEFAISRVGLGTVQAYNTVTLKVRVDGEVKKIAFREGQDVQAGDVMAQIDPRPYEAQLHQAEADKARDEALLANAKLDLDRYSKLAVKEFATRQSVDTQEALVAQYQAAVAHDLAVIDNARVQLGYTTIVSPLAGRTGIRLIDQGNIVHASDSGGLVVVTQMAPISVIFALPQKYLPEIADAMRSGTLVVLAYDQDDRVKLGEGRLELIDNQIDQGTGSIRLKAIFQNLNGQLWPGQFVSAHLLLGVRRGPIVPDSALQSGPNGSYAYVVRQDSTVEIRPVRIAASRNGEALIESGLAAGETIVIDGHYRLRPGARVVTTAAPANERTASTAHGPK